MPGRGAAWSLRTAALIAALPMLAACGQKGGLYLPPAAPAASAPASR